MGYYRIKDSFVLRGWEKLPWALVQRPHNRVSFLSKEAFDALSLCNGRCDCSMKIIPQQIRSLIAQAQKEGVVEPCAYGEGLHADQEYYQYPNRFIKVAHWSVTGKCNYKCRHCYMSAPDAKLGELPHETVMDMIEQIAACGILRVSITGGEPLIRKDWWEMIDALVQHKIWITTIYTNGALVNEALLDGLKERGLCPEFNMSYDGDEGWHDWLRGIPGAEGAVLKAFDLCFEKGFPTGAEMCLHKGNLHLLRQSIQTLAVHHCTSLKTNPVSDTELWSEHGEGYALDMEKLYEAYLDYVPQYFEDGAPVSLMLGGFFQCKMGTRNWCIPLEKYDGGDSCLRQTLCGHARQVLYISPESRMLPCLSLSAFDIQKDYPKITDIGLRRGLTDSVYMSLIDTRVEEYLKRTRECADCTYAKICAGGCRASALMDAPDDIMAPDRAACRLFRGGWADRLKACMEQVGQEC